jgi:hypothetical protein
MGPSTIRTAVSAIYDGPVDARSRSLRIARTGFTVVFLHAFLAASPSTAQTLSLGAAANYGVFELSGSNGNLTASRSTINGNVALDNTTNTNKDTFSGASVNGAVSRGSANLKYSISGGHVRTPTVANLSTANAAAISASKTALSFTPEKTYGTITKATTISGNLAFNVFNLSGINLSGSNLTINGTSSETFVFNVSRAVLLSGAKILLTGGVAASDVIFNVTGGGTTLSGSTFNGTILDVGGPVVIAGARVNGAVLSEKQITISGGTVNAETFAAADPPSAPEPATIVMAFLGCLAVVGRAAFARWKRSSASM